MHNHARNNKFCCWQIGCDACKNILVVNKLRKKLEYFNLNKYQMFEFLGKNVRVGTVCTVKIVNFMQGSSQVVDWYANGNATAIFLGKFLVESILQLTHSYAHFGRKNIRVAGENQSLREMNSFLPN